MSLAPNKFLPFPVLNRTFKIKANQYSTSQDPRGCIPVFEYQIKGQPIMWDRENGHVHFTGIWKALCNSKADIVKIVDSNPELKVKKVRGGCLVIQGTWVPHEHAFALCARTAWEIRDELLPIFGPSFLESVLPPGSRLHGCLVLNPLADGSQKVVTVKAKKLSSVTKPSVGPHPYKRETTRAVRRAKIPVVRSTPNASMSVSSLLNNEDCAPSTVYSPHAHSPSTPSTQFSSPFVRVTPVSMSPSDSSLSSLGHHESFCRSFSSPPMRVVPSRGSRFLPEITGIYGPEADDLFYPNVGAPLSPQDIDIIERVEAGIRLQCLSQDFGRDPTQPLDLSAFPTRVKSGETIYRVLWNF